MKAKKVCLTDSQMERLVTDTTKIAKGIDDDICPTVREIVEEKVPKELRIKSKGKKKKEKSIGEHTEQFVTGRIKHKMSNVLDKLIGDLF